MLHNRCFYKEFWEIFWMFLLSHPSALQRSTGYCASWSTSVLESTFLIFYIKLLILGDRFHITDTISVRSFQTVRSGEP